MIGVEVPMKVNRSDIANSTIPEQLLDLGGVGTPPIIKSYDKIFVGSSFCVNNILAFSLVGGQGFFSEHITTHIHKAAQDS